MVRADATLTAVQRIHEAPLMAEGWTQALPAIAAATGSQQVNFNVQDASGRTVQFVIGYGLDSDHFARFRAAAPAGVFPQWWHDASVGTPMIRSASWPDRVFLRSAFYNEVVRQVGSLHGIHTPLLRTPNRYVYLMVARMADLEDYGAEDIAAIQFLVPNFMSALHVMDQLARADLYATGACSVLNRLGVGVVLVDAAARILFANRPAEAVLAARNGLTVDKEGLRASNPDTTRALRRLIANCAEISLTHGGPGGSVDLSRPSRAPLRVLVAPARSETDRMKMNWLGAAQPAAILIITDPEQEQQVRKEDLRRRFGLTIAEAEVAVEIVKGDGRDAVAARLGVSMTTVRTHLSHIFGKTGARRQAELVHLLMDGERCSGEY